VTIINREVITMLLTELEKEYLRSIAKLTVCNPDGTSILAIANELGHTYDEFITLIAERRLFGYISMKGSTVALTARGRREIDRPTNIDIAPE
jgi:CRP-like cAMP-binding protein